MPKHLLPKGLCKFINSFIYDFCGVFYRIIIVSDAFTFDNLYKVYSSLYYKSHVKWMMYFILVFLKEMKITNQWPSLDCMIEKNTHLINRKKYFEFLDIKKNWIVRYTRHKSAKLLNNNDKDWYFLSFHILTFF